MKSTIFSLLCTVVINLDSLGIKFVSSHCKNDILHGQLASQEKPTYIASLQLNGIHICSSGLFRENLLLTTGPCAYDMFKGMTEKRQTGTALLGDSDLNEEQRVVILDISFTKKKKLGEYDLGLILLSDTVDYTHIEILPLYTKPIDLRVNGRKAFVCGSKTVSKDGQLKDDTEDAQYLQNLHCINISLLSQEYCQWAFSVGDFRRKLMCGQASSGHENTTLGDVGSPLIENIEGYDGPGKYIIGVTLPLYQSGKGIFLKFVRMNYGFPFIEKMMEILQCHEGLYTDNIGSSSSKNISLEKPSKRLKISRDYGTRNVYTGKECLSEG